ncbi:Carbohydrate sulfotransferase 14 [Porphyridium purpureum]|uniref:Carbohydrate sulfotransferase 14 n=1 Tax=Porphyridium purpureum TaxID=35688 RepID=A0A5J4Z7W4_PORPP|nr:Carbohydrate sulfotransferase 14 [Porphyridium purpureum]|eukprot:POR9752..scf295_1
MEGSRGEGNEVPVYVPRNVHAQVGAGGQTHSVALALNETDLLCVIEAGGSGGIRGRGDSHGLDNGAPSKVSGGHGTAGGGVQHVQHPPARAPWFQKRVPLIAVLLMSLLLLVLLHGINLSLGRSGESSFEARLFTKALRAVVNWSANRGHQAQDAADIAMEDSLWALDKKDLWKWIHEDRGHRQLRQGNGRYDRIFKWGEFWQRSIYSEELKFTFCPVPRAASTTWKYSLRKAMGRKDYALVETGDDRRRSGFHYVSDQNPSELAEWLTRGGEDNLKFIFVRNPYTRVLSAYLSRILYMPRNNAAFKEAMASAFPHVVLADLKEKPSFAQFVGALELQARSPARMHEVWAPVWYLCSTNILTYDYIGKLESLTLDVIPVLRHIGMQTRFDFPSNDDISYGTIDTAEQVNEFYTQELKDRVFAIFKTDFETLGYERNSI